MEEGQKSSWMNLAGIASYAGRGKRFMAREIDAGRLRAARIGGRREYVSRPEWVDEWFVSQAEPLMTPRRRSS